MDVRMVDAKWLFTAIVAGTALPTGHATAASAPVVAVFSLENKGSALSAETLDRMSDYVGAKLAESGQYQVVPRADVRSALIEQKKESYKECYAESCQIEIGKELAAQKALAGAIVKFGQQCLVTLKLFDLVRSTQEAAGTAKGACDEGGVLTTLDHALSKLTGKTMASNRRQKPGKGETWYDADTDRTWQVAKVPHKAAAAAQYCEALSLAGFDDWRLPSESEIRHYVNDTDAKGFRLLLADGECTWFANGAKYGVVCESGKAYRGSDWSGSTHCVR